VASTARLTDEVERQAGGLAALARPAPASCTAHQPANVLFNDQGQPCLADFGVARPRPDPRLRWQRSGGHSRVHGPEQCGRAGVARHRRVLWAPPSLTPLTRAPTATGSRLWSASGNSAGPKRCRLAARCCAHVGPRPFAARAAALAGRRNCPHPHHLQARCRAAGRGHGRVRRSRRGGGSGGEQRRR
jgi:hypothetical protein